MKTDFELIEENTLVLYGEAKNIKNIREKIMIEALKINLNEINKLTKDIKYNDKSEAIKQVIYVGLFLLLLLLLKRFIAGLKITHILILTLSFTFVLGSIINRRLTRMGKIRFSKIKNQVHNAIMEEDVKYEYDTADRIARVKSDNERNKILDTLQVAKVALDKSNRNVMLFEIINVFIFFCMLIVVFYASLDKRIGDIIYLIVAFLLVLEGILSYNNDVKVRSIKKQIEIFIGEDI